VNDHDEPALYALVVEPRIARPGEIVRLCFRTLNLGATASPPATVRFFLPPEIEALDDPAQAAPQVPPGAEVVAALRARITTPLEDGLQLWVRAALELEDEVLATNRCALLVRSTPLLDGPESGVFVTPQDDQTIVVRAVVCNEGDGPACDLRLRVPAPLGCSRLDGEEPATLTLPRLEVGERTELRFVARIDAPSGAIVADEGVLRCGEAPLIALPARDRIALVPALSQPEVCVSGQRRAVRITIAVRNEGWADACEVALRVILPAPLRPLEGSVEVDGVPAARRARGGAFAHVARSGATTTIALARVPARSRVEVSLGVAMPLGFAPAPLRVILDEHEVSALLAPAPVRALRLRVVELPRTVEPGATITILAEIANAGDIAESIALTASGRELADDGGAREVTVAPGTLVRVALTPRVRADVVDDARVAIALRADDAGGERAHTRCTLVVRDRAWLVAVEPPRSTGEGVVYALRNAGTTTAHDLTAAFAESVYALDPLLPGAGTTLAVREQDARRGGRLSLAGREVLALAALGTRPTSTITADLDAPGDVVAGATFAVRARVRVAAAAEQLTLRAPVVAGATYVPGSTGVDGVTLLDRAGASPLAAQGLVLRGVPAQTEVAVSWSLLADAALHDATLAPSLVLILDDEEHVVEPARVAVRGREPFAARPAALAYHLEAYALAPCASEPIGEHETRAGAVRPCEPSVAELAPPLNAPPPPAGDDAFWLGLRLDDARLDRIARVVRGAGGTLAGHLVVLRALLPDHETSCDPRVAGALETAGAAVVDLFGRLYVKLRIPGFVVAADDLEDRALRSALTNLFGSLLEAAPGGEASGGATVRLTRTRVRELLSAFADAPYGGPATLRALVALIPSMCEDEPLLSAGLARYGAALEETLGRCAGLAQDAYEAVLADEHCEELDDARAAVLAALRSRVPIAGVA
jgi:hypothetical protein